MKIVQTPYLGESEVKKEWIDANGHMNVGHYLSAFDDGSCPMFDELGLGWDYTKGGQGTIFIMSSSLDFLRELLEGDKLKITTWLIGFDKRKVHIFQELFHAEKNVLAWLLLRTFVGFNCGNILYYALSIHQIMDIILLDDIYPFHLL